MRQLHVLIVCALIAVLLLTGTNGKRGGGGGGSRGGGSRSSSGSSSRGSSSGSRGSSGSSISSSGSRSRTITTGGRTRTYTYSSSSARNYNNGARYYMRRTTTTSTSSFGYSYYGSGSYYYSGYGYRMYHPPSFYYPVYVGYTYYYYPPMFYYYHRGNSRYWNGNRPRYTCRNDNAFWPLENQTTEFVDGRPPALDLSQFDQDLPDPDESSSFGSTSSDTSGSLTELNSFLLNQNATNEADDDYSDDDGTSTADSTSTTRLVSITTKSATQWTTMMSSIGGKRKILAYNYFACPDGKDPDEIYCCGPSTAQYCCAEDEYSDGTMSWGVMITLLVATLVFASILGTLFKVIRRRCFGVHHVEVVAVPGETVAMTTQTVEYIPAPMEDGMQMGVPPVPGQPYPPGVYPTVTPAASAYPTAYPGYQPVPGPPPGYMATQNPSDPSKGASPYPAAAMPTYPPPGMSDYPTGSPYPPVTSPLPYPNNG